LSVSIAITPDAVQARQIDELLATFPRQMPKAITRAVNRTAESTRTRLSTGIRENIKIKKRDLDRDSLKLRKAKSGETAAEINVSGKRIPVFDFDAKPRTTPTRQGVTYQISAGGGRTRLPFAFFAQMASGRKGIFRRIGPKREMESGKHKGKMRQPIVELFGPSIPHVAETDPALQKAMDIDATDLLRHNLARQMDELLAGRIK
jgi:hypothetical protein